MYQRKNYLSFVSQDIVIRWFAQVTELLTWYYKVTILFTYLFFGLWANVQ